MNPYQPVLHQLQPNNQATYTQQGKTFDGQQSQGPASIASENPQLLGQSTLNMINQQMCILDNDIRQNNNEIRLLNNKIVRPGYQNAQLKKLLEKEQKLQQKRQQYAEALKNHQHLKQQILNNKLKQSQIKHSLGQEYQLIIESRKRMQKQQKQREKQQQLAMINLNKQALAYERQRKRQLFQQQKQQAQQELRQKEQAKQRERQQQLNEKIQYNQILNQRSQMETQKDLIYRQYYNHFKEQQEKLQSIYKQKAFETQLKKQQQRQLQQKRQYETFQMRMLRQNEQKMRKITMQRESLKSFLQQQIQQSYRRKMKQKQDQLRYQNQVRSYQTNMSSYQMIQREKKRQYQKKYQQELASQIEIKNQMNKQILEDSYRSSSLGRFQNSNGSQFMTQRKTHNPVTNPIDFKIGITNPYVIKEYEQTKQKYMGDNNLKLRNLAMIGNNSLVTPRY